MCHHDVPWYFTKFYHQTCLFCNRAKSVFMEQSKFLDASIGLDESVTFHYGLPCVVSLLCVLAPKNLKYAKVGCFWCSLVQADPLTLLRTLPGLHRPRIHRTVDLSGAHCLGMLLALLTQLALCMQRGRLARSRTSKV